MVLTTTKCLYQGTDLKVLCTIALSLSVSLTRCDLYEFYKRAGEIFMSMKFFHPFQKYLSCVPRRSLFVYNRNLLTCAQQIDLVCLRNLTYVPCIFFFSCAKINMELSAVFVRNYFSGCQGNFRKSFKRP